jgi:hypothetical protein
VVDGNTRFAIFMGTWAVLGVIGISVFFVSRNVERKKRYFPAWVVSIGLLFVGFSQWIMGFHPKQLIIIVPAVVLIAIFNLRATRFCPKCGRTIINKIPLERVVYCPKCGQKLDERRN